MTCVTTYYLQMLNQHDHCCAREPTQGAASSDVVLTEVKQAQYQFNRFLYQLIGEQWQWRDKLNWSAAQWEAMVTDPNHRTWVAYHEGAIIGYFELLREELDIEILYFGLSPQFIGRGYGRRLLDAGYWTPRYARHGLGLLSGVYGYTLVVLTIPQHYKIIKVGGLRCIRRFVRILPWRRSYRGCPVRLWRPLA